jgi:CBS domain-containing protein
VIDDSTVPTVPTIADLVPVFQVMTREVICAREDLEIGSLMDLMVSRHIGCVPIVDDRGRPIGMVTKFDLLEQLCAAHNPDTVSPPARASDVMMQLAFTLDEHATVAHAAAMMSVEDVHHVPIVADGGGLIGVVSTMDIVRWLVANDGMLRADVAGARSGS